LKTGINQIKSWILPKPISEDLQEDCILNYTLQKVLIRRGFDLNKQLDNHIRPLELPNPEDHFKELKKATHRIIEACTRSEKVAICGDYDADGITSTVLLVELLSKLGAIVKPYIPSRQEEGYGLNLKMINDINNNQIKLVITVDNGVTAFDAIKRSNEVGIDLIITDHHKITNMDLNVFSIIHPENTPTNSPYKFLAGVGLAYLLSKNICNKLNYDINQCSAKELFCIGTIADMAPLQGANRKWLKQFLPKLKNTNNKGIKSIIKKLSIDSLDITADDIGYKIAPLINAVGRVGDPKVIIDLLISDSANTINNLTKDCFAMNKERKRITSLIEDEALDIAFNEYKNGSKFLVLSKSTWHPGIIGIVAARIVDKFNLPTAILARADNGEYRGSIRSNNRLKVNISLDECNDILIAHGGHSAAAGFTIKEENIIKLKHKLNEIAKREFKDIDLNKTIKVDAYISLSDINNDFYIQLMHLGPFGIMNPKPIFWSRKCRVLDMYKLKGGHLKLKLENGTSSIDAIRWNISSNLEINDLIDIAFYVEINRWKNNCKIQLNLLDIKKHSNVIDLKLHNRIYKCELKNEENVLITNEKGQYISSDLFKSSEHFNKSQIIFAKKILAFAEIALGKAA
tara:strand:+ start:1891 stop:3780 length:1890 start_codon:yes stop_codon:yes gene_type:complete